MATYTVRVETRRGSYLVEMTGDNRWNILAPKDLPKVERDVLTSLLRSLGDEGSPWSGGFPGETGHVQGVIDAYPKSKVVKIDPPFEFEEGVVY